ncbi:hypothetical protein [Roseovarius aestuariivivens]|uniref:hypothetical protein n=1 Tax=Roseovarius aestuariivivens TaxID=1888910 RepID=UPI0014368DD8|nr:hypothetical protein [Roseovarius aestuariivivens]
MAELSAQKQGKLRAETAAEHARKEQQIASLKEMIASLKTELQISETEIARPTTGGDS